MPTITKTKEDVNCQKLVGSTNWMMINTVLVLVLFGKPTNETADETTGPHGSGETTCSDNKSTRLASRFTFQNIRTPLKVKTKRSFGIEV